MNFFDQVHETQITRYVRQPRLAPLPATPLHRRLFPVGPPREQRILKAREQRIL